MVFAVFLKAIVHVPQLLLQWQRNPLATLASRAIGNSNTQSHVYTPDHLLPSQGSCPAQHEVRSSQICLCSE